MTCRNVIAVILAAGLLSGCELWQRAQMEVGMYPVDPPRPETPMPPPGSVAQANWAAQRATTNALQNQGNTAPVNYQDPVKLAAEAEAARQEADRLAAAKAPAPGSKPAAPPPRTASAGRSVAAPATAGAPSGAMPVAPAGAPAVVAVMPGLPAGYRPSPSAADDPKLAMEQQQLAAATGAMPTPPEMAGSMKDMGSADLTGWRAHLASHRTESAAINEWQELLRANPALYGQFDPQVEWVDTPNRGSFARLMLIGFAERKDADAACAKIRSSTRYCASVKD